MPRRLTEYERVTAALDAAQAAPCAWCEQEPRTKGDHLGARCREWMKNGCPKNRQEEAC